MEEEMMSNNSRKMSGQPLIRRTTLTRILFRCQKFTDSLRKRNHLYMLQWDGSLERIYNDSELTHKII